MALPNDPLRSLQWHLDLIGDIETVWADYTGASVTVGVYDDGFEYTHDDLKTNYDATLHFRDSTSNTYDPMTTENVHGTAVAGLLGAEADNGLGGVGVAYDVTMTGINFVGDIQFEESADALTLEALAWAANFDIMNNSWGEGAGYGYLLKFPFGPSFYGGEVDPDAPGSLADPASRASLWEGEYAKISAAGRDGLGTVIVQAAGNDASNANGYALNASRFTITVASTDSEGNADPFSNWGTSILVAAPAASVTTDLMGANGANTNRDDGNYFDSFSGTSAATPIVSGVVALMLEANETLGWRDVQNILALSASLTGSAYGGAAQGSEVSTWDSNGASMWNGGGVSFHFNYGFGMVDALAAVRMAEAWSKFYASPQTSANEQHVSVAYAGSAVAVPDDAPAGETAGTAAEISLEVTDDIAIESIAVTISATHARALDTVFTLVAPDGTEIPILAREGEEYYTLGTFDSGDALMKDGFEWTFEVTAFLGMSSAGDWTLRVEDFNSDGLTGQVEGFALDIFGATAGVDDVHHFTDDFLELRTAESGRGTISDTNGGVDWMNLVAVSDDVVLDLASRSLSVGGALWATIATGSEIENAAAGDGNDALAGNGLDNAFDGGRGNDTLLGRDGNDRLWGQGGDDRLDGGRGLDRSWGGGGNDKLFGRGGKDLLVGGDGSDLLKGANAADTLKGGGGADTLVGGKGSDGMTGGKGADRFVFTSVKDSPATAQRDIITDFRSGADTIVLSAIDANANRPGDQAFRFIGDDPFSGAPRELRVVQKSDGVRVMADTDGDGSADFSLQLAGMTALPPAEDFVL
ncbi:S8 family serine peptidase [Tropicimonas isoalkanivorans]|uniref:Serine protease, subtilisin family n=1 Tax=Tropicimonas isoalkanivorans TaxID=441112 RepID=A0A1I1QY08_9RHOB|nr:S8 family serine peptidase [Tropicimonas isoalkanivorans]SFD26925.1 Serine protease, subtilisin family [Tropicimonas isoalkanivorans]